MLTAASGRDLSLADDMAAVLYWRLTTLARTNPGPLPWLPGISEKLHAHAIWDDYLAKRSQLVADLAGQVADDACQGDAEPVWAAPGSHPEPRPRSRNRSMARRQRHRSPRPATDRRSRPTRDSPPPAGNSTSTGISPVPSIRQARRGLRNGRQHTPHLDAGGDDNQHRYQTPGRRPDGPTAPGRY